MDTKNSNDQTLENWITGAAPQANPVFREELRARLIVALPRENRWRVTQGGSQRLSRLAAAAVALLVVTAILLLSPAGAALAKILLEFGPFRLTDAPTSAERYAAGEIVAESYAPRVQRFNTAAEASAVAGFTVLYPRYMPAGYQPEEDPIEVTSNREGNPHYTASVLVEGPGILYYSQSPYLPDPNQDLFDLGMGSANPIPVTVNGNEGVFIDGYVAGWAADATGNEGEVFYNTLIWTQEVDGQPMLFWLHSSARLPMEELLAVAESMQP